MTIEDKFFAILSSDDTIRALTGEDIGPYNGSQFASAFDVDSGRPRIYPIIAPGSVLPLIVYGIEGQTPVGANPLAMQGPIAAFEWQVSTEIHTKDLATGRALADAIVNRVHGYSDSEVKAAWLVGGSVSFQGSDDYGWLVFSNAFKLVQRR